MNRKKITKIKRELNNRFFKLNYNGLDPQKMMQKKGTFQDKLEWHRCKIHAHNEIFKQLSYELFLNIL